jgi:sulfatase modifying factor 1
MHTCPTPECRNRGVDLSGNRFCPECGGRIELLLSRPTAGARVVLPGFPSVPVQKSVVGGDQVITHNQTTQVFNQDETKSVRKCAVSGRQAEVTLGHVCPKCGQWVHQDYFDRGAMQCENCRQAHAKYALGQFEGKVREFLSDGVLSREEITDLQRLGAGLGISPSEQETAIGRIKEERARSVNTQRPLSLIDQTRLRAVLRAEESGAFKTDPVAKTAHLNALRTLHASYPANELIASLLLLKLSDVQWEDPAQMPPEMERVLGAPCFAHDTPRKYLLRAMLFRGAMLLGQFDSLSGGGAGSCPNVDRASRDLQEAANALESMFPDSAECHLLQAAMMIDSLCVSGDDGIREDVNLLIAGAAAIEGNEDARLVLREVHANMQEGLHWGAERVVPFGEGLARNYFEYLFVINIDGLRGMLNSAQEVAAKGPSDSAEESTPGEPELEPIRPSMEDDAPVCTDPERGEVGALYEAPVAGGIRFRFCPPGSFRMGSPEQERDRGDNEGPVSVTISRGFWMGETPVTQAQWEALMKSNPSEFVGADLPVENVSWVNAQAMVEKLNKEGGGAPKGWRFALPTEAQWEYACRAGTQTAYGFGTELTEQDANFEGDQTTPVKSYRPNPWGLYDMHGNVWEWCADWYETELEGGIDPKGPEEGVGRVYRGGRGRGRKGAAVNCRAALRSGNVPGFRGNRLGFRLALIPSSSPEAESRARGAGGRSEGRAEVRDTRPLVELVRESAPGLGALVRPDKKLLEQALRMVSEKAGVSIRPEEVLLFHVGETSGMFSKTLQAGWMLTKDEYIHIGTGAIRRDSSGKPVDRDWSDRVGVGQMRLQAVKKLRIILFDDGEKVVEVKPWTQLESGDIQFVEIADHLEVDQKPDTELCWGHRIWECDDLGVAKIFIHACTSADVEVIRPWF